MNRKKEKIIIFHIYRNDGSSLFLHPFDDRETLFSLSGDVEVEGRYGREPRVESLTMFRNRLYRLIETGVKEWISDTKFIPRFIISAAVFMGVYLFTSLVIRDPIPMVDETVVSLLSAAAAYFYISKRDQSSEKASGKRLELRIRVDRIVFNESSFVKRFEKLLHFNESAETSELVPLIISPESGSIPDSEREEAEVLLSYLDKMFSGRVYRRQEKKLSGYKKDDRKHVLSWAQSNKVDLSLYAAYRNIKLISLPD